MKTPRSVIFILLVSPILILNSITGSALDEDGEKVCPSIIESSETYTTMQYYRTRYTIACGFLWRNRCSRYRQESRRITATRPTYETIYICCSGYTTPTPGSNECTEPICVPNCVHGSCEGPNVCECLGGYHGSTCQSRCSTNIDNCETVDCTSSFNAMCTQCLYHIDDVIKAYELDDGQCNQLCSWRSDSKSCYPGRCQGSPDSCICDIDFNQHPNCMTIDVIPTVSHCSMILQHDSGVNAILTTTIDCQLSTSPPVYVSVQGNGLFVNWVTRFTGPTSAQYPFPYYVNDFKVGVVSAAVNWSIYRGGTRVGTGDIDCDLNHNKDDPNLAIHTCGQYGQLNEYLQNGDRLDITASSTNGGYLQLNNYDFSSTATVGEHMYYQGKTVQRYLNIIVDLEAPMHCSLTVPRTSTCIGNSLDIDNPFTKLSDIEIRWSTWLDTVSGLKSQPYKCEVCEMVVRNNIFDYHEVCSNLQPLQSGDNYEAHFKLTSPGLYCAILGVGDIAGNTRYARRCFTFDDQSDVAIVGDNPMHLTVDGEKLSFLETDAWTTRNKSVWVSE